MKSKTKLFSLLFLAIFLISGVSFGATRFLFVAPGETFTPGGAKISTGLLPQVAGVPFNVTVYSVNDSTWTLVNTAETTTLSATQSSTYNPSVPFFLDEDSISPAVSDCKKNISITINPAVTSNTRFDASGPSGILPNSLTITVQKIDNLLFNAITSPQTAGTAINYTLTARQTGGTTATNYQGTASISAVYTGEYTTPVAVATFVNGVATGSITLYDATEGAQRVTLTASVSMPTGVTPGLSTNFAVNPAAATQLLLIGPGQLMAPGVNSGNGRTGAGSITETTTAVISGSYFYVTVYAVDAYWNTVTGASGTVTLSSADALATTPAATAFSSGKVILPVTMGYAGTTVLTANHSGAYTPDVDSIPVTHGEIDHFEFTSTITDKTANQLFLVYAAAHDINHNIVQNFNNAVTFEALKGGTTPLVSSHWYRTPSSPTFINGVLNGTVYVRIYERLSSCNLRLTYNTATGISNSFVVSPAAFSKLMILAPGESFNPGAGSPVDSGKTGSPNPVNAGSYVPLTVYATDAYSNLVTSAGDTFEITSSDSNGAANGVTPPVQVSLAGGIGSFNFQFFNNGTQGVYANDVTNTNIGPGSVSVVVQAGTVSYYDFTGIPSAVTAGNTIIPVVAARDSFGNLITSYSGNAWVTSPDTDWTLPAESTINIATGTRYGSAWYVTFTAGQATLNMSLRRAGSARIFVCDDPAGTTQNALGHRGLSNAITVNFGSINRMQVVPPGMTARPGTADGIDGAPTGQLVADTFTVTVNACDSWWNVIKTGTGSSDTIRIVSSNNDTASAALHGSTLMPLTGVVTAGLSAGTVLMDVMNISEQPNFYLEVSDLTRGSIAIYQTPYINIFFVDHFRIQGISGLNIGDQVAGVPFTITITAENSSAGRITSFAGVQVELRSSNQDSDSEYTLSPTRSVTFTAGVAIMQVTMYKASNSMTGESVNIEAKFGSVKNTSLGFNLWPGSVTNVLVLVNGMTHKPGLAHIGIPGYKGYYGSPNIQEANYGFKLDVLFLDANFNRVRVLPVRYCNIGSSDPLATIGSPALSLSSNGVYVTITAGAFTAFDMKLFTVGSSAIQTITALPGGSLLNNQSPEISLRHTLIHHFGISVPSTAQTAGVPFNITIQALDAYNNVCDNRNLGVAFTNSVNLTAVYGGDSANTMYPSVYPLVNGQAVASVRLFKAPDANVVIHATSASILGDSGIFEMISNEFKRLLILDNTYAGMEWINGEFTGSVPTEGSFPMATGRPFLADPSQATVSYQAGMDHFGRAHMFRVFACDAYGNNVIGTPDLAGNTITITMNDTYGQPVTPTSMSVVNAYNDIALIFHTAKAGMSVSAHTTQSGIADYTTPTFTTYAGPAYGLQLIVPGMSVVEGSGRTIGAFSTWYNGVAGTPLAQPTGVSFTAMIQSADIFGNFKSGPTNALRVYTAYSPYILAYPDSHPTDTNNFTGSLGDYELGRITFTAKFAVTQNKDVEIKPQDMTAAGPSNLERVWISYPTVPVVIGTDFQYELVVNGVKYSDNQDVTATVSPDNFNLSVNIVTSLGYPIGSSSMYRLVPVLENSINTETGTLLGNIPGGGVGSVTGGVLTLNPSYSRAERIRIRVDNPNPGTGVQTGPRWSCVIDFGANSLSASMTAVAAPSSIGSGQVSQIRAQVVDSNGNSVPGREVEFEFLYDDPATTGTGDFGIVGGVPVMLTRSVTDSTGLAVANFTGGYINGRCRIVVRYFGNTVIEQNVTVNVSLVDPAEEISNYPNPFRAGAETTNISFYVAQPVGVKLKIYTLMGKIVLEKEYTEAEVTAMINASGNMVTYVWDGKNSKGRIVGNGGYICYVEAGQEKYKRKIAVKK